MNDDQSELSLVDRLLHESRQKTQGLSQWLEEQSSAISLDEMTNETVMPMHDEGDFTADTVLNESLAPSTMPSLPNWTSGDIILNERYEKISVLGKGGMGVVLRVRDKLLNRTLAMKIMHSKLLAKESAVRRFIQEAQVCAQLQHPNILAIHELGVLDGGHIFITMTEIKGESFDRYIHMVHDESDKKAASDTSDGWNMHRLVAAFHDVCKAVAHAHERGVVHRDLKPNNIMVGQFGEVLLVDWGLAKVIGTQDIEESITTNRSDMPSQATVAGIIFGTPAYLAPELAVSEASSANEKSDIYALGTILYELLRGEPAFQGDNVYELLVKVAITPPASFYTPQMDAAEVIASLTDESTENDIPMSAQGVPLPKRLVDICERAMRKDPQDRYDSAREMVEALGQWLDGSKRRSDALALVHRAQDIETRIKKSRADAQALQKKADALNADVEPWHGEERKAQAWAIQDAARSLLAEAGVDSTERVQLLRAALAHKDDLEEAHIALAEHYIGVHRRAEAEGDDLRSRQAEVVLREHAEALPQKSPLRDQYLAYLKGVGHFSLTTDPSGADLSLSRVVKDQRRWRLSVAEHLGTSPIQEHPLDMGSYVMTLRHAGYHDVTYPVYNQRLDRMDTQHPDGRVVPIQLLPLGTLEDDDCYVPAGWCWLGGDVQTPNSLPRQRVWIDGFVIKTFPVTHLEYMDFLNDLVANGCQDEAALHAPREQSSSEEDLGAMVYRVDEEGRFSFPKDPTREICWPSQPVTMIQWRSARAYASWKASKTGKPWRLPMEFEWEKSARGVDGRFYPWGNEFDPSWACMKDSHDGSIRMQSVNSFPHDVSIYGVRGTAGNTRDWCLDRFREEGPKLHNGALIMATDDDLKAPGFKSTRGGSYGNSASRSRSADRDWWFPERSYIGRGFRIAWSVADLIQTDEQ